MKSLTALLLISLFLSACSGNDEEWESNGQVDTQSGPVQAQATDNGAWEWLAIPYAAAPVGELRWQAPRDPQPWTEALSNSSLSIECTQLSQSGSGLTGSEDCLYLNVWRPQNKDANLPVYVWIHGGGNTAGSADEPTYYGANMAVRANVVYVSMNYRLGPLGWLYEPSLQNGDSDTDSGNFGTLDIIKSLEWIRDNIEQFGGDPDNVFITGESAGGINVLSLLISPRAEGLFHKAMSQSGLLADITLEDALRFADSIKPKILVSEGLAADISSAETLLDGMSPEQVKAMLLEASTESIINATPTIGTGLLSMPFIFPDGTVIHSDGPNSMENGNYPNKVPLILGTNSGDVRLFQAALALDRTADPVGYNASADIGGMLWKAAGADDLATAMSTASGQPDIFVYSFEWGHYEEDGSGVTPAYFNFLMGSAHSLDIPFFLDTLDEGGQLIDLLFTEENRDSREMLSDAMISYLQNFISSGNPNGDHAYPDWQAWSNADGAGKYIVLDANFTELNIAMRYEAVNKQTALDALAAISDDTLRTDVTDFLLSFTISCALLSDQPSLECASD